MLRRFEELERSEVVVQARKLSERSEGAWEGCE